MFRPFTYARDLCKGEKPRRKPRQSPLRCWATLDSLMKSEEDNNGQDSSLLLRLITG
jgi:hypothetical protein